MRTPKPKPIPWEKATPEHKDLHEHVNNLLFLAERHCGPKDPRTLRLEGALSAPDDLMAPLATLREVERWFYEELPEADRREILGGWPPFRARPSNASVKKWEDACVDRLCITRSLLIAQSLDPKRKPYEPYTLQYFRTEGAGGRVAIHIDEGTTQAEAIDVLFRIMVAVATQWDELLASKVHEHG